MSKLIAAPIIVVFWIAVVVAGDANPARTVNLNKPGALEVLQQFNRTHYEKVRKIPGWDSSAARRRRSSLDTDELRRAERKLCAHLNDDPPS